VLKIIDIYILKKFILTFIFGIVLLTFVTIVIDISEKADDFVSSGLSAGQIITQYYIGFIPHIVSMLFPLFVFISVIFFTSKMAGRSEIVAILASGTSFYRFLRPYWVGSIFLTIVLWFGYRYVTPAANSLRTEFQTKYIDKSAYTTTSGSALYFRNDSTHYGQISYFDTAQKRGTTFSLQEIKNNRLVKNIRADALIWDTAKNKWRIEYVVTRTINGNQETVLANDSEYISLNFKPAEFVKTEFTKDVLQTPALTDLIKKEKMRGKEGINDLIVEKHRRDASPVSIIILTIIGVSVSSRKLRGGSGLHLAIGFIIAALYILTDRFSTIFSTKGDFPPILAAWTPNMIFAIVAIYMFVKAPK
jgi:lipopolysaccharide export system permease protein